MLTCRPRVPQGWTPDSEADTSVQEVKRKVRMGVLGVGTTERWTGSAEPPVPSILPPLLLCLHQHTDQSLHLPSVLWCIACREGHPGSAKNATSTSPRVPTTAAYVSAACCEWVSAQRCSQDARRVAVCDSCLGHREGAYNPCPTGGRKPGGCTRSVTVCGAACSVGLTRFRRGGQYMTSESSMTFGGTRDHMCT